MRPLLPILVIIALSFPAGAENLAEAPEEKPSASRPRETLEERLEEDRAKRRSIPGTVLTGELKVEKSFFAIPRFLSQCGYGYFQSRHGDADVVGALKQVCSAIEAQSISYTVTLVLKKPYEGVEILFWSGHSLADD